jgi:hypothetical protein
MLKYVPNKAGRGLRTDIPYFLMGVSQTKPKPETFTIELCRDDGFLNTTQEAEKRCLTTF